MSVLADAGVRKKSEKPGTEITKVMPGRELGVQEGVAGVASGNGIGAKPRSAFFVDTFV